MLVARGSRLRLRHLEVQGRQEAARRPWRKELIATGRTARPVTGFRAAAASRSAPRLALQQNDEGRWRVEFDEAWAKEGAKPPEVDDAEREAPAAAADTAPAGDAAVA